MLLALFVNLKDMAGDILYFCCCQQMAWKDRLLKLCDFPGLPVALSPKPIPSYCRCKSLKMGHKYIFQFLKRINNFLVLISKHYSNGRK